MPERRNEERGRTMICRNIGEASDLLRLLGNPNRLAITCLLLEGERTVMELEVALGIRQPTLSQQLAELRAAGIIEGRRMAKHIVYRVSDPRAGKVVTALRDIFDELLPASLLLAVASSPLGAGRDALAEAIAVAGLAERGQM